MTTADLKSIVDALYAKTARRLVLSDDVDKSQLIEQHLQLDVLQRYDDELAGLDEKSSFEWLVGRMVRIEASVSALQAAVLLEKRSVVAVVGSPAELPTESAKAVPASPPVGASPIAALVAPPDVSVEFDQSLIQSGFYHVEGLDAGVCYRWLGPDPVAKIYVPKIAGRLRVAIRVEKAYADVPIAETLVSVDDGQWTRVELVPWQNGFILTSEPPPGRPTRAMTTCIAIDCIRTVSPQDTGSTDIRRLGLAISGIDLSRIAKGKA